MHAVNRRALTRWAVPVLALAVAVVPSAAFAGGGHQSGGSDEGDGTATGGRQGKSLTVETKIQTRVNGGSGSSPGKTGTLSSANSNWTPPACWYEPAFSPKQLEATVKVLRSLDFVFLGGIGNAFGDALDRRYKDGEYKNYNLDKQGKGMFWAAVKNPNRKDDPEANSCKKPPFWVDDNETPKEKLAVSPKILAEYAYDELPVPATEVKMAPNGETKVNLPTWIWLDKAKFKKISVTASLPHTKLSATTTAEPVSLTIDPGTKDAETFPASGECPIRNGRIGEPYAKGKSKQDPPCGVKYLRSSGDDSYKLKATVTWKITWTSTTEPGEHSLPEGEFGADQDVTVKEIQSVNR